MMSSEASAIAGTRLRVWTLTVLDFVASGLPRSDFITHDYASGTPMGAERNTDRDRGALAFFFETTSLSMSNG